MLFLPATTDKISIVTTKAGNVHVVACFTNRNQTTGAVGAANRQLTAITGATTTDIVASPGASTTRSIKTLTVCNANTNGQAANGDNTITVQLDANGTLYELYKTTLAAGDIMQYVEGVGFASISSRYFMDRTFVTTSDQVLSNQLVFTPITGLECDITPGLTGVPVTYEAGRRYNFLAHIYHISAASTTGAIFAVAGGVTPATGLRICAIDCIGGTANTDGSLGSGTTTNFDTTIISETAGVAIIAMCIISGFVIPYENNSPGNPLVIVAAPEVAANLTIKRGSWLRVWEQSRKE